jgi:hypothetical protein
MGAERHAVTVSSRTIFRRNNVKRAIPILCLVLVYASPARADIRYTTHVEVRQQAPTGTGTRVDFSSVFQTLTPPGDTVTYVGTEAIRIERQVPTRSVVLLRADGQVVIDPGARTYSRVPELGGLIKEATALPPPAFRRTGEFATILNLRAERIELKISVPLPISPPPGFPTVMVMTGDVWLADGYTSYAEGVRKATGLVASLPAGLEGLVLRQILRSAEFGFEVESRVTELVEGPIAPELFTVPAGYRDITGKFVP